MTAARRRERNRNRARRARRREERERAIAAAIEAMRVAREERRVRLGPFVEMYGDGSTLLHMIDRFLLAQDRGELPGMVCVAEEISERSDRSLREVLLGMEER